MNPSSLKSLQQAAQYYAEGKLDQAESACRALYLQLPNEVDVAHLLALISRKRGDYAEAERLFHKCIELNPQRADILANLGNLYRTVVQLEAAEQLYQKALIADPAFRPARLALTRLFVDMSRFTEGQEQAEVLLKNKGNDAEAWAALAACYRGTRDYDRAQKAFETALKIAPDYTVARQNLGALLTQINRHEEALRHLALVTKAGAATPQLAVNRATALAGLGQFDEAVQVLREAVAKQPESREPLELLARIRYMRGEKDFAKEIEEAAAQHPDNTDLVIGYAGLLQGADLLDEAEAILLGSVNKTTTHPNLFCALAAVQQLAGKYEDAWRSAQRAIENGADRVQSQELAIDALMSLGRTDEALPLIQDARRHSPLNQWYIAMEATAARIQGGALYPTLYDYDNYVQSFELEPPAGWSSIAAFNADLLAVLSERHKLHARPLDQSLRNGTQTPSSLLSDSAEVIQNFLGCLTQPIEQYRKSIGTNPTHPLEARNRGKAELIGCWSVLLKRDGFHFNHVHPEGWLSSAYYVETPAEIDTSEDKSGWIKFGESRFPIAGLTAEKFVKPSAGKLVLFPSYMWHGTVPIKGDEPRLTIAFDAITK